MPKAKAYRLHCQFCGYCAVEDESQFKSNYKPVAQNKLWRGDNKPPLEVADKYRCPGCGRLITPKLVDRTPAPAKPAAPEVKKEVPKHLRSLDKDMDKLLGLD